MLKRNLAMNAPPLMAVEPPRSRLWDRGICLPLRCFWDLSDRLSLFLFLVRLS